MVVQDIAFLIVVATPILLTAMAWAGFVNVRRDGKVQVRFAIRFTRNWYGNKEKPKATRLSIHKQLFLDTPKSSGVGYARQDTDTLPTPSADDVMTLVFW